MTGIIPAQFVAPKDPPEPKQVYINDVLISLEEEFPGTGDLDMPADALDDSPLPEGAPMGSKIKQ